MLFLTHVLFGILSGVLLLNSVEKSFVFFITTVFFSCMPDIDHAKSKISRRLWIISWPVSLVFKHRGIIHSVWPWVGVFFVLKHFGYLSVGYGVIAGYLSHLVMDGLTVRGVRPFFPLFQLRIRGFITSGGFLEKVVRILILLGILVVIGRSLQIL